MILSLNEAVPADEVGLTVAEQFHQGADFIHVRGLPLAEMESTQQRDYIREASSRIGRLTLTAGIPDSELWELNTSTSPNANFIPFHSDNPFYDTPEEVVGFWNIHSSCKGGENIMLPVHDLVGWMHGQPQHKDLYRELVDEDVTFTHKEASARGAILDPWGGVARYDQKYISPEHKALGERLTAALQEAGAIKQQVKLADGEALFFNNRTVLHARAPYSDTNRLSIRVRAAKAT
jgi:hypothetical protein